MPLKIIRNDISKASADAIVNTANPQVAVGAGVDQTIYEAAGSRELLAERAKIGPMSPGQSAATPAFALDAKYIIHTVGPAWEGGGCGEREAVASCYRESLKLADELCCESVAFSLISTGTYGLPKDEALKIAVSEISSFLFTHDMTVYMVVYDRESFVISGKAFADIRSYIEERDVRLPA
ncbi:MAG: macro domain-containing protein, partial [Bacillota bacterium]|nr:macro domain-containing protein [Bacillota bacterium]